MLPSTCGQMLSWRSMSAHAAWNMLFFHEEDVLSRDDAGTAVKSYAEVGTQTAEGEDKEERHVGAWEVSDVPVMQVMEEIVEVVALINAVTSRVEERIVEWENIIEPIQLVLLTRNQVRVAEEVVDFPEPLIKEDIVDVVQSCASDHGKSWRRFSLFPLSASKTESRNRSWLSLSPRSKRISWTVCRSYHRRVCFIARWSRFRNSRWSRLWMCPCFCSRRTSRKVSSLCFFERIQARVQGQIVAFLVPQIKEEHRGGDSACASRAQSRTSR